VQGSFAIGKRSVLRSLFSTGVKEKRTEMMNYYSRADDDPLIEVRLLSEFQDPYRMTAGGGSGKPAYVCIRPSSA
jgi:hypothetical protein